MSKLKNRHLLSRSSSSTRKKATERIIKSRKKIAKGRKEKNEDILKRLIDLQNLLFPKQSLQERNANFSEFYLEYGTDLIPLLKDALVPLFAEFVVVNQDV